MSWRILGFSSLLAVAAVGSAGAGTIGLRWDPSAGALGYRVRWGPSPGQYTELANVGPATQFVLDDLADCTEYFVSVTAYNEWGDSLPSAEVTGWARPVITSSLPVLEQGGLLTMNVVGGNFRDDAELLFDQTDIAGKPLVQVEALDVISCHEIEALVQVEPGARGLRAMEVGSHSLRVRNSDGTVGTGEFIVQLDDTRLDINRSDASTLDRIDGKDLVWLAVSFARAEGNAQFRADADLDGDGFVDGDDLHLLATDFGSCWTGTAWSKTSCP